MAFPATPLDVEVSLALGADLADPDSWSWTDITSYVREGNRIRIRRGRSSERSTIGPSRCTLTVDNTDGRFCRLLPTGAWYGQIGKNTPLRVRVDNGSGYVTRFVGYVSGWPPSWDPSEADQTVTLTADGILRRLGQGRVLRSALYRSMVGVSAGDYTPHAYWPMEDGADATRFASGVANGVAASFSGSISLASDTSVLGSDPLPSFGSGSVCTAAVPSYSDQGQWMLQFVVNVPSEPAGDTTLLEVIPTAGGTVARWRLYIDPGAPSVLWWIGLDSSGASTGAGTSVSFSGGGSPSNPSESQFYGQPIMVAVGSSQDGSDVTGWLAIADSTGDVNSAGGGGVAGTHTAIRTIRSRAESDTDGIVFGHFAVFTDPTFDIIFDVAANAAALAGWSGERAHERVERLCREERVPVTVTATESQAMGAQGTGTLVDELRACATADFGLLFEPADDAGLRYLSSSERYNLTPAITLQYDQGHISPPWDPNDDDRDFRNDVTATRSGGSSARVTDDDSIDAVGVYDDTLSANTETDEQLSDLAGWAVNLGTVDELRWPAVRPNLRANPSLIDDWMAADIGSLLAVTDHPSPLAPDDIVQVIEGYEEVFGSFQYDVTANLSPASGWTVAELDDDEIGKLDTAGTVMHVAATSGATSFTVHTEVLPKWTTDAGEMPIPILVSGQVNSVTAIANVSPAFVAAGTVAHGNNASVTPTMPAGVQAGDLLLVLAAIRNSGTGTVDTPSGYTVLLQSGNVALLGKIHTGTESAPQITFTGGVANADTSAQMCAFRGVSMTVHASSAQLNASAQDIAYPALDVSRDNCAVLYLGWKQDDWTSVTSPGTAEIGEPDTTTGDDQGIVWAYTLQTTAAAIASGSFTVTGGASAISRGAVVAVASDVQTMTVTRGSNNVTKAIAAGEQVNVYRPARLAL